MYTNGATIVALDEVSREHALPNQEKSEEQKIKLISDHFREIMKIIGLDIEDDSLINTPRRVAKMYIKEIFSGLNPANKPRLTLFDNKYKYNKMVLEKDITLY